MKIKMGIIAALLASPSAFAASTTAANSAGSWADFYYSDMDLKVKFDGDSGSIDGDGGGIGLWLGNGWSLFTAEVQKNKLKGDGIDASARQLRVGLGARFIDKPNQDLWLRAEYLALDGDIDVDGLGSASDTQKGYGIHAGGMLGRGRFNGYAEIGSIQLEDLDGFEYRVGANYQPGLVGGFIEYRVTDLETDNLGIDEKYKDFRVGIRVSLP